MTGHSTERRRHFQALYESSYDEVLLFARRRAPSLSDADDVVAETFLTAWRRLEDVPSGAGQQAWLYGVAHRVLANQRRGGRRRRALSDRLEVESTHADDAADGSQLSRRVDAAFEHLPEKHREVLGLAYWEDLKPREIAIVLGCSRNAARLRLHRARQRLAKELKREDASGAVLRLIGRPSASSPSSDAREIR